MKKRLLLYFHLWLVSIAAVHAQGEFYFRHYQVENGLSHNTVMCSLQDEKGFIWLGTKDGLNRFDGTSFKVFRHNPANKTTIGNDYIRCLYLDKSGRLFVGTQRGLYQYQPITESFTHIPSSGSKSIKQICVDRLQNVWYIAEADLVCQQPQLFTVFNNVSFFAPTALCTSPDGNLWVASSDGQIKKYDAVAGTFKGFPVLSKKSATTCWIERIYAIDNNQVLVGTSAEGLYSFDLNSGRIWPIISLNQDKTGIYVRDILKVAPTEYWVATESGIFIYDLRKKGITSLKKNYHNPYSLSDNAVYTLCRDREGGVWAGTYFGGVNYYAKNQLQFQKYFPDYSKNTISGNAVREIIKDRYGNLWVGTEDAGLNKIDPAGNIAHFMPGGESSALSYYNIHGLLAVGDELWVGTFEHGLDILHIPSGKVIRHYAAGEKPGDLKSNFVFSLYHTRQGQILVGTTAGVFRYQKSDDSFHAIPQLSGYTYNILEDHAGVLWSATISDGVKFFDPATGKAGGFLHDPTNSNSISNNMVNALYEDRAHNIWMGTEGGGACRLGKDRKTIRRFNTDNGLPSNFIFKILEDEQQQLWITTSKGLVQLNPQNLGVKVYTSANGLLNDQFNYNSGYKDEAGVLYFGSVKGMISFRPETFFDTRHGPPVYFTGFQVNNVELPIGAASNLGQSMTYTRAIELTHKQSSFSIDFAALSYTAPQMTTYAYIMEGLDTGWTYLEKNRKVYFTDLSPGKYKFRVKTASGSGVYHQNEATLSIMVLPPWWASRTAKLLYVLLGVLLTMLGFHYYHKHVKKENQQKIDFLIFEKEKEIYDAKMKFFTNIAHEIRTPLTLIKGPLERIMEKTAAMPDVSGSLKVLERNTNRLIHLTDQLLDYRKTEAGGFVLTFGKENISRLVEEIFSAFKLLAEQRGLLFSLHLPHKPLLAYADKEVLTKILSNLLSNAIKYAAKEARIGLRMSQKTKSFYVEVDNDGPIIPEDMKEKIFEPFVRLKGTEKLHGTGIGLALARSLTELHQGTLTIDSRDQTFNRFVLQLPIVHSKAGMITNHQNNGESVVPAVAT